MSQENVQLVRLAIDAFNRRDFEAALAIGDESTTWRPVFNLEESFLKGKETIGAWWRNQVEKLDLRVETKALIPVGDSAVVLVAKWVGEGRMSGTPVEAVRAQIFTFERGTLVRVESYSTRAEALKAVGLEE